MQNGWIFRDDFSYGHIWVTLEGVRWSKTYASIRTAESEAVALSLIAASLLEQAVDPRPCDGHPLGINFGVEPQFDVAKLRRAGFEAYRFT